MVGKHKLTEREEQKRLAKLGKKISGMFAGKYSRKKSVGHSPQLLHLSNKDFAKFKNDYITIYNDEQRSKRLKNSGKVVKNRKKGVTSNIEIFEMFLFENLVYILQDKDLIPEKYKSMDAEPLKLILEEKILDWVNQRKTEIGDEEEFHTWIDTQVAMVKD